ncbi:mitochondrial carrier domain-containing protein [Baffinella frigidus]|nr:mitochondrial carrier domain-containing protein [Cryptophyta sp. CCMP2293]
MAHLSRSSKIEDVALPDMVAVPDRAAMPVDSGGSVVMPAIAAGESLVSMDALSHAISGSVGGNLAMLVFYPLDQLVIRAQTARKEARKSTFRQLQEVLKTEGVRGLYRGMNSTLITLFTANFIYFYAFHILRLMATKSEASRDLGRRLRVSNAVFNLLLGTLAGAINVMFVQPLWVANSRLKLQGATGSSIPAGTYSGVVDVIMKIFREEGFDKLWAGLSSSLLLCCNPAIQFAVYETIKNKLINQRGAAGRLRSLEAFALGAMAKWVATVSTYPVQVAQTRLRFQRAPDPGVQARYRGTIDCITKIFREEGKAGLFSGMETKLWHSTLISALMFLTYEKIQKLVERVLADPKFYLAKLSASKQTMAKLT